MDSTIKRIEYYYCAVEDKHGKGYWLLEHLRQKGVNLVAFTAFPTGGGRSQLDFVPDNPESLKEAVEKQLSSISRDIHRVQGQLSKEIALEIHSRLAMAASCPILAVLGALLGAIFRKGQFLVAVGLCIGPAVVAMLFVIMGQRMVDSPVFSVGMAVGVAWTGLILLVIANLVLSIKVLRR